MSALSVRVLLIDESLSAARQLQKQLTAIGFMQLNVSHIKKLDDALACLSSKTFDIVLLSLSLPGVVWTDAIRLIQSRDPHIPIVGLIAAGKSAPEIEILPQDILEFLIEDQNDPVAVSLAIRYATRQQSRANSLHESEERFRIACAVRHAMVYDIDARSGKAIFVHGLPELLGYSLKEVPQTKAWWFQQIHEDDVLHVLTRLQEDRILGSDYSIQYRIRHKNGSYIVVEDSGRNIRDEQGCTVRSIGSATNITKRKSAEDILRKSEQSYHELVEELEQMVERRTADLERRSLQLQALAAELAHAEERERKRLAQAMHDDLQQLLVGAKLYAETLAGSVQKASLKESARRLVQFLNEAIESARSLTFELSPPILHNTGLALSLHYLGERMKAKHGLTVNVQADEQAEPETEDIKVLLFQAARELLFNIVKHARIKSAAIEARRSDDGSIQITVSDSGVGFNPNRCAKDDSRYGFGLFNIRERLEVIGGRLDIESAPGSGCRCMITVPTGRCIPVNQAQSVPLQTPALPVKPKGGLLRASRKIRVLVADNLAVVRQGVIRLLEEHKDIVVVGEASDGQEALELARQINPDVILMEVKMPRLDGIAATLLLRREFPQVRVIGLSSGEESEQGAAIGRAGAFAVLDKTGHLENLAPTIRNSFVGAA
jgi:PAS domain S-box-containing protein